MHLITAKKRISLFARLVCVILGHHTIDLQDAFTSDNFDRFREEYEVMDASCDRCGYRMQLDLKTFRYKTRK